MAFSYLFAASVIFLILICDGCSGKIDNKEKVVYSLACSFFCGALTANIILSWLRKRTIEKLFGGLDLL